MIAFKSNTQRDEFHRDEIRADLKWVVVTFSAWVEAALGRDILITGVLPEEGIVRKSSSHKDGRAVDIRTRNWNDLEIKRAAEWINACFSTGIHHADGKAMAVAVHHDAGYGPHFHIQVGSARPVIINVAGSGMVI